VPGIDFRAARAGVRIAEVLDLMGFSTRRVLDGQVRGPCPLHRSQSPTSRVFAVHLDKQVYYCFRCGTSGNALDLWAAWTRQSFYAAVLDLYTRLHRDIPWLPAAQRRAERLSYLKLEQESKPMPDP